MKAIDLQVSEDIRQKILREVHESDATLFVPHHKRGALICIADRIDFLDIAVAIATDDSAAIKDAIDSGSLIKPTLSDIADWCVAEQRFQVVVLQPYVLVQKLLSA